METSGSKDVAMNFKVTEKFRRDYKAYAAITGKSMTSLLSESFYNFLEHESSKKRTNSPASSS